MIGDTWRRRRSERLKRREIDKGNNEKMMRRDMEVRKEEREVIK